MHHGFFVLLLIAISSPLCAIASAAYLRHYRVFTAQKNALGRTANYASCVFFWV